MNKNNCYDIKIDVYLYNVFKKFLSKQFPINKHGLYLFFINIIHFLLGLFNVFGWMLPSSLLIYHLIIVIFIIISWIFIDDCILTKLVNNFSNKDENYFHIRNKTILIILIMSALLSFIGYIYPNISFYNIIYNFLHSYKHLNK